MSSLSYQQLPSWLLDPLMAGAISVAESSALWDQWLLMGEPTAWIPDDPRLQQAAVRLNLLQEVLIGIH